MNHARGLTDGEIVLATIDIDVPPPRVFDALNSAEVEKWWGEPSLYRMQNWQCDLRPGGRWQVDVVMPDGAVHPADGRYLVVQAPSLVVLSRRYNWDHPTLSRQVTKLTYRFDPIENGTRVTVRQEEFGSPEAAREHAAGWERTLNLLAAYLAC